LKIYSESSSNLLLSTARFTISDLLTTIIIGIPRFVLRTPSFKANWFLSLFVSSDISSFLKFPSSSNCGSSYNLINSSSNYVIISWNYLTYSYWILSTLVVYLREISKVDWKMYRKLNSSIVLGFPLSPMANF
jgi:hypothetical protein